MECIICQDTGSEPLQENTSCSCKYKCHSSCWIDYVHSKNKITCPLCRKDLTIKDSPKPQPTIHTPLIQPTAPPYAPPPQRTESTFQQITYQEFIDIIQHTSTQNTVIEVRPSIQPHHQPQIHPRDLPTSQKITKLIIGLSIIALIVTVFVVFMKIL